MKNFKTSDKDCCGISLQGYVKTSYGKLVEFLENHKIQMDIKYPVNGLLKTKMEM